VRQNIGAKSRQSKWAAAHGSGIIQQQRHASAGPGVLFDFKAHGVVGLPQSAQGGPHPECLLLGQTTSFGFAACLKAALNSFANRDTAPLQGFQLLIR
jgi:hypothetical protein